MLYPFLVYTRQPRTQVGKSCKSIEWVTFDLFRRWSGWLGNIEYPARSSPMDLLDALLIIDLNETSKLSNLYNETKSVQTFCFP
jgi:hypothetical protein